MMRIICGDSLRVLKKLETESIDCVMTSPPYWALRNYNVAGQLGLEPTFEEYIKKLVCIFDEVKRVLKSSGTCFVNLGDTYSSQSSYSENGRQGFEGKTCNMKDLMKQRFDSISYGGKATSHDTTKLGRGRGASVPEKSLCNIPARFSIAMQDKGWILRQTIIWHKPNCMPASVRDRFTNDFEYLFFFTKNKNYFFEQQLEEADYDGRQDTVMKGGGKYSEESVVPGTSAQSFHATGHERWQFDSNGVAMRNMRAVWRIPTQPYSEAHFATFPEELVLRPLKAGCPKQVCRKCGKPREAIWEGNSPSAFNVRVRDVKKGRIKFSDRVAGVQEVEDYEEGVSHVGEGKKIVGYSDCGCGAGFRGGGGPGPFCW